VQATAVLLPADAPQRHPLEILAVGPFEDLLNLAFCPDQERDYSRNVDRHDRRNGNPRAHPVLAQSERGNHLHADQMILQVNTRT
jgi:hypothetical protein